MGVMTRVHWLYCRDLSQSFPTQHRIVIYYKGGRSISPTFTGARVSAIILHHFVYFSILKPHKYSKQNYIK